MSRSCNAGRASWHKGAIRARAAIASAVLVIAGAGGCGGDDKPKGVAPARTLDELISRYYDALAAGDVRIACALTNPESVTQYERDAGRSCETYFDGLIRSWGPATRKLVGEIELSGDPDYIKEESEIWTGFDPKAPLIIDRPEDEIRSLLGDELKDFDRSAKLKEVKEREEEIREEDPESLTVFETYGFKHPVAFFLISHVGAVTQYAENLNAETAEQKPHWVMGKVRGLDLLGEHMLP